jgi:hypothetical protein
LLPPPFRHASHFLRFDASPLIAADIRRFSLRCADALRFRRQPAFAITLPPMLLPAMPAASFTLPYSLSRCRFRLPPPLRLMLAADDAAATLAAFH